jgi:hypothetical protein
MQIPIFQLKPSDPLHNPGPSTEPLPQPPNLLNLQLQLLIPLHEPIILLLTDLIIPDEIFRTFRIARLALIAVEHPDKQVGVLPHKPPLFAQLWGGGVAQRRRRLTVGFAVPDWRTDLGF